MSDSYSIMQVVLREFHHQKVSIDTILELVYYKI